jgi:hypothetical protein
MDVCVELSVCLLLNYGCVCGTISVLVVELSMSVVELS